MTDKLSVDFVIGNYASDLVDYTLTLCGKDETKKTLRFPAAFYNSFVDELIRSAVSIHREVMTGNSYQMGSSDRDRCKRLAVGECCHMSGLVLSSRKKGWISEKQHDTWQKLIAAIRWKLSRWK